LFLIAFVCNPEFNYTLLMNKKKNNKRIILERRFVPKGTVIIEEGEAAFCAYLIQSGSVLVYRKKEDNKITELATLHAGEICGEMAIIYDETTLRSASVKTLQDCNLILITRAALKDKLENSDPTVKAVAEMLVKRVRETTDSVVKLKGSKEE